ncbi:hypothetical protein AHAS_Ahas01G0129500 [Arachis hypogaea]
MSGNPLLSIHCDGEIVYDEEGSIVFRSGQPIIIYMTLDINSLTALKNVILHALRQQESKRYEVNPDDGDDADEEPPEIPDDGDEEEDMNYYGDTQIALTQPAIS